MRGGCVDTHLDKHFFSICLLHSWHKLMKQFIVFLRKENHQELTKSMCSKSECLTANESRGVQKKLENSKDKTPCQLHVFYAVQCRKDCWEVTLCWCPHQLPPEVSAIQSRAPSINSIFRLSHTVTTIQADSAAFKNQVQYNQDKKHNSHFFHTFGNDHSSWKRSHTLEGLMPPNAV